MIEYIIVMKFISWMIAIMMSMGCLMVASCKRDANNPDSELDAQTRMGAEFIYREYEEKNFVGRVVFVLWIGAKLFGLMTEIFDRRNK